LPWLKDFVRFSPNGLLTFEGMDFGFSDKFNLKDNLVVVATTDLEINFLPILL